MFLVGILNQFRKPRFIEEGRQATDRLIFSALRIASGCENSSAGIEASDHNGLWMRVIHVSDIAVVRAEKWNVSSVGCLCTML